jgi:putative resolvase
VDSCHGIYIHGGLSAVASRISFAKRTSFFLLIEEVINYTVDSVIISPKDRLSRVGFDLFHYLFQRFGPKILVRSEFGSPTLASEEILDEILSFLHWYSMPLSRKSRAKQKLEVAVEVPKKRGRKLHDYRNREMRPYLGLTEP